MFTSQLCPSSHTSIFCLPSVLCAHTCLIRDLFLMLHHLPGAVSLAKWHHQIQSHLPSVLCAHTCLIRDLFLMLHHLPGAVSLAKWHHQIQSHLSNHLSNLTSSSYPIDCVCVCVYVCVCVHVFMCLCVCVCVCVCVERGGCPAACTGGSLFLLCFGSLLCNGLCASSWRNSI